VESGLGVDRILVVTYTVAATEELRARIRSVLAEARAEIAGGRKSDDDYLAALVERVGAETAFARIESAVSGFDEAAIFPIHGFCQRVLGEKAFESGMAFQSELLADESELLTEIAEDFWRRRLHDASPLLATFLVSAGESPVSLLAAIRDFIGKPYLRSIEPAPAPPTGPTEERYASAFARAREIWRRDRARIAAAIAEPGRLHRGSYKPAAIAAWLSELDDLFTSTSPPLALPEKSLPRFTPTSLARATLKDREPPRQEFFDVAEELLDLVAELGA